MCHDTTSIAISWMPDKSLPQLKCAYHFQDEPVPVLNLARQYLTSTLCVSPKCMSASWYCNYSYYISKVTGMF